MQVPQIDLFEDRLLVFPDAIGEKFEGSRLIKPDVVRAGEKACRGVVVLAGPGCADPNTGIWVPQRHKQGDRIIFGHYAGVDFEESGVKYKIMRPADVFAGEKSEIRKSLAERLQK